MPDDHHLSNIHSRIQYYDNKFIIEDMDSTNGYLYFFLIKKVRG